MIEIIAHRGYWLKKEEMNSIVSFERALINGFGIETDLRDYKGDVVISHDIANKNCVTFEEFMVVVQQYSPQLLSLNIKADGLQKLNKSILGNYSNYFFFDMSVPDALLYAQTELTFYTRFSDVEDKPSLFEQSKGVWVDNFSSNTLDILSIDSFLKQGKLVVLVSPELHHYEYMDYWTELLQYIKSNSHMQHRIGLCTDFPMAAKEFFSNVR